MTALLDRRGLLAAIGIALGGCAAPRGIPSASFYPIGYPQSASAYGPILDHGHEIPALDLTTGLKIFQGHEQHAEHVAQSLK